jgi:hypothetical protein
MPDINFKEYHRRNPKRTERLLRDVMNYEKPGMFPNWGRAILWLVVLPLLSFALVCAIWIIWSIIKFALNGFVVKPF